MSTPKPHEDPTLDDVRLPAGTLIHVAGYPFYLAADTTVKGRQVNYDLAVRAYKLSEVNAHLGAPVQPGDVQPGDAVTHAGLPPAEQNIGRTLGKKPGA